MMGCREAPSQDTNESAQAGQGGQEGGKSTLTSLVGEYTVQVKRRDNIGPYGGPSTSKFPSYFQLSLREKGETLEALVTAPFGTTGKYTVEVHPSRALTSEESILNGGDLDGPVLLKGQLYQAEVAGESYEEFAFSLDDSGHIKGGAAIGYSPVAGLDCHQNASGTDVLFGLEARPDVSAPEVRGGVDLVPWEASIALSEPATIEGEVSVQGAEVSSIEAYPSGFIPIFNDQFALSGKTVSFLFPALRDTAGNSAPAEVTLSFADLGEVQPSFSFANEQSGACAGRPCESRLVRILSKPGATKARLTICYESSPGALSQDYLWVSAHASSGGSTQTSISPAEGLSTLEIALPAETAAIDLQSSGCGSINVVEIEAL